MNYGYAIINENGLTLDHLGLNWEEIFCYQMYHFVVSNHHNQKFLKG